MEKAVPIFCFRSFCVCVCVCTWEGVVFGWEWVAHMEEPEVYYSLLRLSLTEPAAHHFLARLHGQQVSAASFF